MSNSSSSNKIVLCIAAIIVCGIIVYISYYLGSKSVIPPIVTPSSESFHFDTCSNCDPSGGSCSECACAKQVTDKVAGKSGEKFKHVKGNRCVMKFIKDMMVYNSMQNVPYELLCSNDGYSALLQAQEMKKQDVMYLIDMIHQSERELYMQDCSM